MKRLKICIFIILTILTINISYPQAMLAKVTIVSMLLFAINTIALNLI